MTPRFPELSLSVLTAFIVKRCLMSRFGKAAMTALLVQLVNPARAVELYSTGFDDPPFTAGENQWTGSGGWSGFDWTSGSQGISADGTAYLGKKPPGEEPGTRVWKWLGYDPVAEGKPMVDISMRVSVAASTSGAPNPFYIGVANDEGWPLAYIAFNNPDLGVYRWDLSSAPVYTGVPFSNGTWYTLRFSVNFATNTWSATLDGTPLFTGAPFHGGTRTLNLGYAIFHWSCDPFGNNYLSVDDISISARGTTPHASLASTYIDENVAPGATATALAPVDPVPWGTYTYALVEGEGSTDNDAFTITGSNLAFNHSPDYETKDSYSIRVKITDPEGGSAEDILTLSILDVDEAPVLQLPTSPVVVEATSASGAIATFEWSAYDPELVYLEAECSPPSGSLFPIGDTTAHVTASDWWFTTEGSFIVRVQDTTGPAIAPHADVIAGTLDSGGVAVSYEAAVATDAVGVTSLSYSHPSGSVFPIGQTTVTITAKDAAENTSTATFTVTVVGGMEGWRRVIFGPDFEHPAIGAVDADPNANGHSNLLDYALGHDPVAAGGDSQIRCGATTIGAENYQTLSYTRPKGSRTATDITYIPQRSLGLGTGWSVENLVPHRIDPGPGDLETVTVRSSVRMSGQAREFLRLKATLDDPEGAGVEPALHDYRASFEASSENLTTTTFEGVLGTPGFPLNYGGVGTFIGTDAGFTIGGMKFVGRDTGGYGTYLVPPSLAVFSLNGSSTLMMHSTEATITLPPGVTAFGADFGLTDVLPAPPTPVDVTFHLHDGTTETMTVGTSGFFGYTGKAIDRVVIGSRGLAYPNVEYFMLDNVRIGNDSGVRIDFGIAPSALHLERASVVAASQGLTTTTFEGLPGTPGFPLNYGGVGTFIATTAGVTTGGMKFVGRDNGSYGTYVIPGSFSTGFSLNGSTTLMMHSTTATITLPPGVSAFGADFGLTDVLPAPQTPVDVTFHLNDGSTRTLTLQTASFFGYTGKVIDRIEFDSRGLAYPNVEYIMLDNVSIGTAR